MGCLLSRTTYKFSENQSEGSPIGNVNPAFSSNDRGNNSPAPERSDSNNGDILRGEEKVFCNDKDPNDNIAINNLSRTFTDPSMTDKRAKGGDQSALLPSQSWYEPVNCGGCGELIATENTENNSTNPINGSNDVADREQILVQTVSGGDDIETSASGTSSDTSLPAETTIRDENCPELNGKFEGKKEEVPSNEVEEMVGRANETKHGEDVSGGEIPSTFSDLTGTDNATIGGDQSALLPSQRGNEDANYDGCEEAIGTEKTENNNTNRINGSDDVADSEPIVAKSVSDGEGISDDIETNVSGTPADPPLPTMSTNRDENFPESHDELEDNKEASTTEVEEKVAHAHKMEDGADGMFGGEIPSTFNCLTGTDKRTTGGEQCPVVQSQDGYELIDYGGTSTDTPLPAGTTIRDENFPESHGELQGNKEEVPTTEVEEKVCVHANRIENVENDIPGHAVDTGRLVNHIDNEYENIDEQDEKYINGCEQQGPIHDHTSFKLENQETPVRPLSEPSENERTVGPQGLTDSITNRIGVGLALPYRQMLLDVKNGMKSQDLKDAKFLIRRDPQSLEAALFPDGVLERIEDALDLFESLERKNYLSPNNLLFLQYILFGIGRTDLQNRVAQFASQRGDSLCFYTNNRNEAEGHAYVEFRFKGSLLNFDRISLEEFQQFLENVLGIPKRYINLTELKPGSVIATFQLPLACIGNLQKLIGEKPSSLAFHRVSAVRISNGHWTRLENQEQQAYQAGQDAERAELLAELDRRQKQVVLLHCDLEKAETEIVELRSIVRKMTALQQIENINERRYDEVMLPEDLKQEQLSTHNIIGPGVKKANAETHNERQYEKVIVSSGAIGKEADHKKEKRTAKSLKERWKNNFSKRGKKSKTRKRSSSPQEQSDTAKMEGSQSGTYIYPKEHKFTQEKTDSHVQDYHEIYDDNVVEDTDKVIQETKKVAVQETQKQIYIPLDEPSHYISLNMEEKDSHRYSALQIKYEHVST